MMRTNINLFSLFMLLLAGMSETIQAKPIHVDSIKVHLPFYGNLNDWSGWNNNGQSLNNVMGTDRYGNMSRAFYVQDSLGFFRVPTKNIQIPTFTYTQWVELMEIPGPEGVTVFEGGTDSCTHSLHLYPKGPDSLWMEYRLPFGNGDSILRMPVRMPLDSWHHLTALRSKDSVFLYFDVLFNEGFYVPGNVCHTGDWLYYGAGTDTTRALKGTLDEVRVFSENIEPALLLDIVVGERLALVHTNVPELRIFPNPGKDRWQIESEARLRSVSVRDYQGRLMHRIEGLTGTATELRVSLVPGIYMLEVENSDHSLRYHHLVVE